MTYHPQSNGQVERYNRKILSALRTYVADHGKDWDLYTDVLTYAYNCLPNTSTDVAPFKLVLSKPPGPLALKPMIKKEEPQGHFKRKWKYWLQETMNRTRTRLLKSQERYKRNYDARLRKQAEVVIQGDYVFLRVERKNRGTTYISYNRSQKAYSRCKKTDKITFGIQRSYRSVEKVSI